MAQEELVKALDYILNRSNERDIEVIAAAVVRRRRDIAMFGSMPVAPDPGALAKQVAAQLNLEGNIEGLKNSVRDYAIRIVKQVAPELSDAQVQELTGAWISPGARQRAGKELTGSGSGSSVPVDLLASMIDQFLAFSQGRMSEEEDQALRHEMGPWPDKYWKSFPDVVRLLLTDYIKGEIDEKDFNTRIAMALR
ncbi:MAG: hypothetical protein FWH12_00945 [Treponema sp.]|nr:hypothetical protein [Treponema sp.]